MPRLPVILLCVATLACGRTPRVSLPGPTQPPAQRADTTPRGVFPFAVDTLRVSRLGPGLTLSFIHSSTGPWAIHVLEVDRSACHAAVAVKGAPGAVGRATTSALLTDLRRTRPVVGGVNADFFLFTPPGVPTNAHIAGGRLVTGPGPQPVLAFDSTGAPAIVTLRVNGAAELGAQRVPIAAWNRNASAGIALFDDGWGASTDSASGALELVLDARRRLLRVDTATAGVSIPRGGAVLVARGVPDSVRTAILALRTGDSVPAAVRLTGGHPREAVGGRPAILRDSALTREAMPAAPGGFAWTRHPRTAVGIAGNGTRLLLTVVDGRQKPWSDGMTLKELGELMLALGARDAINLDGGGSSALVYADPAQGGRLVVANRPSDPTGERPVANALAIVRECR